jgi:hypothetical protein
MLHILPSRTNKYNRIQDSYIMQTTREPGKARSTKAKKVIILAWAPMGRDSTSQQEHVGELTGVEPTLA